MQRRWQVRRQVERQRSQHYSMPGVQVAPTRESVWGQIQDKGPLRAGKCERGPPETRAIPVATSAPLDVSPPDHSRNGFLYAGCGLDLSPRVCSDTYPQASRPSQRTPSLDFALDQQILRRLDLAPSPRPITADLPVIQPRSHKARRSPTRGGKAFSLGSLNPAQV